MDDRHVFSLRRVRQPMSILVLLIAVQALLCMFTGSILQAQEASWIWSPTLEVQPNTRTQGEVWFRKKFTLIKPEVAQLNVAAGDEYELYINDKLAARGESYGTKIELDVRDYVMPGVNLVAARVRHISGETPGLAVRLRIREQGETRFRSLVSDASWKTHVQEIEDWEKTRFEDPSWLSALPSMSADAVNPASSVKKKVVAKIESPQAPATAAALTNPNTNDSSFQPASNTPQVQPGQFSKTDVTADKQAAESSRQRRTDFRIDPEFRIEQVMRVEETESIAAMEFDEFGRLLLSRVDGPLMIADPSRPASDENRIRVYCEQVKSCRGICSLNGDVYVTGDGPNGQGLYRLTTADRSGQLMVRDTLLTFTGDGEGARSMLLGPDGMLYVVVAPGSKSDKPLSAQSPFTKAYEGDMVARYEDPRGREPKSDAPCGTVIRVSLDGSKVERVAGGFGHAHDLAFDQAGNLFLHEGKTKTDTGMPWERDAMTLNVVAGGDYGYRSGWAKFAQHFIDRVPVVCQTGSGDSSGVAFYQHVQFPVRYQNTLFVTDRSAGQIFAVRTQTEGAGFVGEAELFMAAGGTDISDLAVGADGALYFSTRDNSSGGGVFRIVYGGQTPDQLTESDSLITRVLKQPQPASAWGRQEIAKLKNQIGRAWSQSITDTAADTAQPVNTRVRALQYMVLYGPKPSPQFLEKLTTDTNAKIRNATAQMCGNTMDDAGGRLLLELLSDGNAMVRRTACESLLRRDDNVSFDTLLPLLRSQDRMEALVARRLLERVDPVLWFKRVMETDDKRIFIQGSLAAVIAAPDLDRSYAVLARGSELMDGFVSDADFVDMLRVMQLAIVRGKVQPQKIPAFAQRIADEFPSGNPTINEELIRLLAGLKYADFDGRLAEYFESDAHSTAEKNYVAMMIQTVGRGVESGARIPMIATLENGVAEMPFDANRDYFRRAIRESVQSLDATQVDVVIENGDQWPDAMLASLFLLPNSLSAAQIDRMQETDVAMKTRNDETSRQLRTGIVAILARNGDEDSMEYLRAMWEAEPDRRGDISIGLAQQPEGKNWSYLVSSLPVLDNDAGAEVVTRLASVQRRPSDAKYYRSLIDLGYRMQQDGIDQTVGLLEHWTGQSIEGTDHAPHNWRMTLDRWSKWYQTNYPDGGRVTTPEKQVDAPELNTAAVEKPAEFRAVENVSQRIDGIVVDREAKGFFAPVR